jgi:phosphoglycolate phosphatase
MSSSNISKTNKKLVIFDFDGVIADTFQQAFEASTLASKEYGFAPFASRQEFYNDLNVTLKTAPSLILNRFRKYGVVKGFAGIVHQLFNTKKFKHGIAKHFGPLLKHSTYFYGIPELLEKLEGKAEMVILSNNQTQGIINFLDRNNLAKYFTEVHGFETTMVKTQALDKIVKSRDLELNHIVFVTDMKSDIKDAKPLNIPVLAVTYGYNSANKIYSARPTKTVNLVQEIYPALQEMLNLS